MKSLELRNRVINRNNTFTTMPQETNQVNNSIVKHEIYTNAVNIPKFCGDPKVITIDAWLSLVDNHITNKGVVEDALKIEVLKQFVEQESGEARDVIKLGHLRELQSYEQYKEKLRKHFKGRDELEPLRAMIGMFTMTKDPKETPVGYLARIEAKADDLVRLIKNSDWKKDQTTIELTQVGKFLAMAKFMTGLDKVTKERLHKDIKPSSKIGDIACHLRTYEDAPRILDPYVMQVKHSEPATRPSRSMSRTLDTSGRSRSTSRPRGHNASGSMECFRCHKLGHMYRECYARLKCNNCQYKGHHEQDCRNDPYCTWHQRVGHTTANCRGKNNNKPKQNFQGGIGTPPQT